MPYYNNITFEVPSGAFFLINTDIFKMVGLFDEGTFLYGEENILGYKIKEIEKKFKELVDGIQKEFSKEKAIAIDKEIFTLYNLTIEEREQIGYIEIK